MPPLHLFYEEKIALYTGQVRAVQKKQALIAGLRLLTFGILAFLAYRFVREGFPQELLWAGLLCLGAFAGLVLLALQYRDRRALLEKLLFINTNELGVLKNEPNQFEDGAAFLSHESYLDDLDIFGPRSLFHLLNRTTTHHGKEQLAQRLQHTLLSPDDIKMHQHAIRVFSSQVEARQSIIAQGLLNREGKGNLHGLAGWLEAPPVLLRKKWVLIIRWILIVYNIGSLLAWAVTGNYSPLVAGILAGWGLSGLFAGYIGQQHAQLSHKHDILEQYQTILRAFSTVDTGESDILRAMQAETASARQAFRSLARLSNFFDQGLNFLVSFFLNNLFLYHLYCTIALEKWKEAYKKRFPAWIELVGNIECLNSFSVFAFNSPDYVYPLPSADRELHIEAEKMAHPLIPAGDRVPNDFSAGKNERLILVTGSNMSGKTTFLRTVGVNLLLAQCGAPVCAGSFSFTPLQVLTSLRVSDSLQEHTSYFMAELKKLRQIIDRLQSGQGSLVLVDEILRGTNSEDKTNGSEQFIYKLLRHHCLSLFATHDLSLSVLEKDAPGAVSNYCFESVIEDGELHFNYRLQQGVARNRNASFLMEKMGII